ncbi:MAG: hypothetical protein KDD58_06265 [Bdellovibrionales bacterium]|nr:hypothetical protein [Bdellovibrionales bacterium]
MRYLNQLLIILFSFSVIQCSEKVDGTLFSDVNKSESCLGQSDINCFAEDADRLSLDSRVKSIRVKNTQTAFNVGGECNEGGFATNRIDWHLIEETNRTVVANSLGQKNPTSLCGDPNAMGQTVTEVDGLNNVPGVCSNGRFNMLINTPLISTSHKLYLCISGGSNGKYQFGGSTLSIVIEPSVD